MDSMRTRFGAKALLFLICLTLCYGLLEGKSLKKPKRAIHKSGTKKHEALPKGSFCKDHSYCFRYSDLDCASEWVELNCPKMCRRCEYEGPELVKLPAVVYYKKGEKKHGITGHKKHTKKHAKKSVEKRADGKRDVVFLKKPSEYTPTPPPSYVPNPTTSYNLFEYTGQGQNFLFLYPDQHPVNLQYADKVSDAEKQYAQQYAEQKQREYFGGQDQTAATANAALPASPTTGLSAAAAAVPAEEAPSASDVGSVPVAPAVGNVTQGAAVAASAALAPVPPSPTTGAATAAKVGPAAPAAAPAVPISVTAPAAGLAPAVAAPANGTVTAPASGATAAVPSANQTVVQSPSAGVQQPWEGQNQSMAAQQLQPAIAAPAAVPGNQTIELINQTVVEASNKTEQPVAPAEAVPVSFQPVVTTAAESNQTVPGMFPSTGQRQAVANQTTPGAQPSFPQTVAPGQQTPASGSNTSLNESQPLAGRQPQNQTLVNGTTSHNLSLPLEEITPQNHSLINGSEISPNNSLSQAEIQPQNGSQADLMRQSKFKPLKTQPQPRGHRPSPEKHAQSPSSKAPAEAEEQHETSDLDESGSSSFMHTLHLTSTGEPNELVGQFKPNGAAITLAGPGTVDVTSTSETGSVTQDITVDQQAPEQDKEEKKASWTCCKEVEPPPGCKPCPKMPKPPPMPFIFNIYCDDLYKDCAYAYSNCNDTWWQINCPKRCNLCQAKDKVSNATVTTTKEIYPNEVKDLPEKNEFESDLMAPAPGKKPLVAKYTLRVRPKFKHGIPQTQEIRIMPPGKVGYQGNVKPLMVLKQNITKPMIENIEIDVPKKGAKYSAKPSVEVIEGDHKEMLKVSKGQAVVEDAVQKSKTKNEENQEQQPEEPAASEDSPLQAQDQIQPQTPAVQAPAAQASTQAYSTAANSVTPDSTAAKQTAAYTEPQTCSDDGRCNLFSDDRCSESWLTTNCKKMCKLC